MITIKPLVGPRDSEVREHIEEALALAMQKAREGSKRGLKEYGLFCPDDRGKLFKFASVNSLAWGIVYGNHF